MRMILAGLAALCFAATLSGGAARAQPEEAIPAPPTTAAGWRAAAQSDLDALHMYLREDTPVALDAENARIQRWFEVGYRHARARVRRVSDQSSYFYALAPYINDFQDPHLSLNPVTPLAAARWPGFIVTSSGADSVVQFRDETDADAPQIGARVLSCDGSSLARLRERTVFPYTLNPRLAGDRRRSFPRLFLDRGNPFAPPPRRCIIEEAGTRREVDLRWRDLPADGYWDAYNRASTGPRAEFGVSTPTEGVTWIGVPTLDVDSAEQLQAIIDQIAANAQTIRSGRAIIIDVRGNGGGSSLWGDKIARALWGDGVVDAIPDPNPESAVDWRASQRNLDYLNGFAPQLIAQFGENSEVAAWIGRAQAGFAQAIASGEPFWRERDEGRTGPIPAGGGYTQLRSRGDAPFVARVYLLSNGACASACLDFADIVLHIPGTQLIGMDTSGDGLLMEVRDQILPSGLARVSLPMKVYRGRARGALEAYRADLAYDGVWDDNAVRAWVMGLATEQ